MIASRYSYIKAAGIGDGGKTPLLRSARLGRKGGGRLRSSLGSGASLSSETSTRIIASTSTTAPLSSLRKAGAFSTARASEIHDAPWEPAHARAIQVDSNGKGLSVRSSPFSA